jgi:hypothetical protein
MVLVWGYDRAGDWLTLFTYDSNFPSRDDITLRLDFSYSGSDWQITTSGTDGPIAGSIQGLFRVPYGAPEPPRSTSDSLAFIGANARSVSD